MAIYLTAALQDFAAAVRGLRSRPAYLTIATVTLALGIGGSVTVFSVVDSLAFASIPYADAHRLAALYERSLVDPEIDRWPVSPASYLDWRQMGESLAEMAAYDYRGAVLAHDESAARARGIVVTPNTFAMLGASAARGRLIDETDLRSGRAVTVISHEFWTRAFGQSEAILGADILLDGEPTTVVGVMPPRFRFPIDYEADIWRLLDLPPEVANDRGSAELFVVARLHDDVTFDQARDEMDAIAATLAERYPETNGERGVTLVTAREDFLEWRRPALTVFVVAVGFALAIVCMNLAGLMLSRGLARSPELAMRVALGASRARIVWLLVSEGIAVAVIGAVLGTVLATVSLPALLAKAPAGWAGPMMAEASVNGRALTAAATLALATAIVASLAPAIGVARGGVGNALRGGSRAAGSLTQMRVRRGLVLGQTVLAVALLAQAGVLARSIYNVFNYDVGFDYDNVLVGRVLAQHEGEQRISYFERLAAQAEALPGVRSVALANIPPLTGGGMPVTVTTDGSSPSSILDADAYNQDVQYRIVSREFFDMLGIGLRRGRLFDEDDVAGAEKIAVVNEEFVRRVLGGGDPFDVPLRAVPGFQSMPEGFDSPHRIVGVVGDVAEWGVWAQPPIVYVPFQQGAGLTSRMYVALKTDVPPDSVVQPLRDLVWESGVRVPLDDVGSLEQHQRDLYLMHDFMLSMVGVFATMAVLLASIGLYGVVALQVGQRTRELSVRLALGARAGRILGDVLKEGLTIAVVGSALAALAAMLSGGWVADSWLGNFLHDVSWFDPGSFAVAVALLVVTTTLACLAPARRAASVDPALALKAEQ